jgi:DNA polymerase-3 subunit gamma/tau
MAAMENCESGPTLEPCGKCQNCKEIFNGSSIDVKEIDAASNRGIDDIRDLQKEINFSPINCKSKYVIIDEAHSLTGQAAEAALKMIEEPPPNVRFILCTTEPEALKPTIHSRCINFNFSKISWMELYNHLVNIVKAKSIQYEEDALKMIAKSSKGSARNALQNLQTVTNFVGNGTITTDSVSKSLGVIDEEMFFKLFSHIAELKAAEAMIDIDELLLRGKRVRTIIDGISDHLRNMLIFRTCINNISEFGFNDEEIKKYSHQSKSFNAALIAKIMGLLVDAQSAVFINLSPQNYLEKFVFESIIEVIKDQKKPQKK